MPEDGKPWGRMGGSVKHHWHRKRTADLFYSFLGLCVIGRIGTDSWGRTSVGMLSFLEGSVPSRGM